MKLTGPTDLPPVAELLTPDPLFSEHGDLTVREVPVRYSPPPKPALPALPELVEPIAETAAPGSATSANPYRHHR